MANKPFQETYDARKVEFQRRANLTRHPLSVQDAARIVCDVHTAAGRPKGFTIDFGMPPDFVKVDGDSHFGRPVCV